MFSPLTTKVANFQYCHSHPKHQAQNLTYALPENRRSESVIADEGDEDISKQVERKSRNDQLRGVATVLEEAVPRGNSAIISACFVGLLTGLSVVIFNNAVHEIRDFFWDGIPDRGASWLRQEATDIIWTRVIFVPFCGGLLVSLLNFLRESLEGPSEGVLMLNVKAKAAMQPFLKAVAACVTLGTGNSLGPEGPSVEIGASVAKGVGSILYGSSQRNLSLVAAGSAAGIASGFNTAVAGCFFAVESVLWPSAADPFFSLTNTTSTVILSAVIASVVSEVGLGSEPAFKVPDYDFRSPTELPLYLLLGILCGIVSLALSKCTSYMVVAVANVQNVTGLPRPVFPVLGSLAVGLIALAYPEILYWGFENVDTLLETRPFIRGLSANLLLQLVGVKIVATALCRAAGLVGGYYAPSLFIGAATGMAYGKFINFAISKSDSMLHLSLLEVASPQAYGLVGMAATLAGVCQVPLTSVLLLFELTQDYRIVLPLLGAVGMSSWVTSGAVQKKREEKVLSGAVQKKLEEKVLSSDPNTTYSSELCQVENSLCLDESVVETKELKEIVFVSQAMRTRFVTVMMTTLISQAVSLMLAEKQSCASIIDDDHLLIGFLTLGDIQEFAKLGRARNKRPHELLVSEMCTLNGEKCRVLCTATPAMDLLSAQTVMDRHSVSQIPVVSEHVEDHKGHLVGLLDRECISVACRAIAIRRYLGSMGMD